MQYNPDKHHRKSIRLKGYDYSSKGMYYITLCVNERLCLFGNVEDGEMILNDAGKMVDKTWRELHKYYHGIVTDEHIVMPNHFHGIILLNNDIVGAPLRGRPLKNSAGNQNSSNNQSQKKSYIKQGQAQRPAPTGRKLSLGEIVGQFESFTMNRYILGVQNYQWEPFLKKLWQRNYYEHIVRNETELNKIRKYILNNSANWNNDEDNPENWCSGDVFQK